MNDLHDEMSELGSAEEFLDYFAIPYDPAVVRVNRLHILQRFHDYWKAGTLPEEEEAARAFYRGHLERAYQDFVRSTPQQEMVFEVFRRAAGTAFVPLDKLRR